MGKRRDPICLGPYLYRDRDMVEQFFNRIKRCRRVAARCDKRAVNLLAFVKLAANRIRLRVYGSASYGKALSQGALSNRSCHPFLRRDPLRSIRETFQFIECFSTDNDSYLQLQQTLFIRT